MANTTVQPRPPDQGIPRYFPLEHVTGLGMPNFERLLAEFDAYFLPRLPCSARLLDVAQIQ